MRISRRFARLSAAVAMLGVAVAASSADAAQRYRSLDEALSNGVNAYVGGFYEVAIPALEAAAEGGLRAGGRPSDEMRRLSAHFFLGRILMDNASARTDHARAYRIYQLIVDEYANVDPDDTARVPYVAKAMTALGVYLLNGVPGARVPRNPVLAAQYFYQAATSFNDEDAQFELAKLQLRGEGVTEDPVAAKHWLSVLTRKGHAGAQAFLADLLWRGKYMKANPDLALALIKRAVANAPPQERIWIEDIYQNIYCGASAGVRKQADGIVADWGRQFTRGTQPLDGGGLTLQPRAERQCGDGEPVAPIPPVMADRAAGESRMPSPRETAPVGFMGAGASGLPSIR